MWPRAGVGKALTCLHVLILTRSAALGTAVFVILGLVILLVAVGALDSPYYIDHLVIAVLIFLFASAIHHVVVHRYRLTDGNWLMGFTTALPFYLSREIRDRQKLGFWDWPGLLWPTIGIMVLLAALELGSFLWRRRRRKLGLDGRQRQAQPHAQPSPAAAAGSGVTV